LALMIVAGIGRSLMLSPKIEYSLKWFEDGRFADRVPVEKILQSTSSTKNYSFVGDIV
jgi:hypothetical protein